MVPDDLARTVVAMRPFLPANDFARSVLFYEALGFRVSPLGDKAAHVQLGEEGPRIAFLLQDFYDKHFAENLMMHLLVRDLDGWWSHIESLSLAARFGVQPPRAPKLESWGLRVGYVWDPAGVLWHIAADP
ncbi:MAG: hypothetical protein JWR08_1266 [Enterovirga sp.]|nr:hypothetical protein [Enterovirga sp.]